MKPIKILLVISTKGWGGTEAYVSLLAKGLSEQGNSVWVAAPRRSPVADTLEKSSLITINVSPLFYLWTLLKIVLSVFYRRIDIIHGNSGKEYWLVLLAGILTFRKVVLTRHLMTPFSSHTRKLLFMKNGGVISPSRITLEVLKASGIPETGLKLIYNGIDPSPFSIPRGRYRALYKIPEKAFVTGIISNLHYPKGKGHFSIIQSIPDLLERIPDAWWIIGGNGPLLPELIAYARKLNVPDRIIFTGNLSLRQVPHVLSSLDIFVLLSYDQEGGCPLSIMEAMACGLPVIASTTGGNREIVEEGKTGFLIAPEDTDSLIKHSIHLFENPEKRKQMGGEGKKRINEFFNYKRMAEESALYYRNIIS